MDNTYNPTTPPTAPEPEQLKPHKKLFNKRNVIIASVVLIVALIMGGYLLFNTRNNNQVQNNETTTTTDQSNDSKTTSQMQSEIDLTKLPLGDDKYSDSPKAGFVYSCQTTFNGGGASEQGPWIDTSNNTWDLTKKVSVDGNVSWPQANWNASDSSDMRTITSKDLPTSHTTGTFPIASTDEAYQYDTNPNSIAEQSISMQVPRNPTLQSNPECVGGEVGIATTGVLIFNAFDAGGRDAVATEVQDHCEGHPQAGGYYHYHGYSSCFEDTSGDGEHSILLGYAYDGFGIFGLKGEGGMELSSDDLDECHGHTHSINWDGQTKEMYHYHMTQDFPYTVSCFRGTKAVQALSSGEEGGMPVGQQGSGGSGQLPPRR